MLRITIDYKGEGRRLDLIGKPAGEWVEKTANVFKADGAFGLTAVTGVEESGCRLLRRKAQAGATLITKALAMTDLVDEVNCRANAEPIQREAADLHFLACLLTGRPDESIDMAADALVAEGDTNSFFAGWMRDWRRRLVIGKALTAIGDELSASVRRTKRARVDASAASPGWTTRPVVTRSDMERALLAIDLFPRAALLLLVFEGLRVAEAATLLEVDANLLKKAQVIGLHELTANLAPAKAGAGSNPPQGS